MVTSRIIARAAAFGRTHHWWLAAGLLAAMFGLSLGAMVGDTAIVDEVAHIPAAYSYLHYGDMRLNPEHPPLLKDLAGLPLQFMHLNFPDHQPAWTTDANGQWEAGWSFIYRLGNNAGQILFWSRLPILLLAIAFGIVLYRFVERRWGVAVALLTLFFYALSPNILGHDHFVTTDLGASVFAFLALMAFIKFAERPGRGTILVLSLALAAANVAKFSSALLYPILALVALGMVWLWRTPVGWPQRLRTYFGGFMLASVVSVAWIWLFYIPHTLNMPLEVQDRLIHGSLVSGSVSGIGDFLTHLNKLPLMKPLAQYVLGLTMVFGRVAGGNTTYFMGQVSNQSFHEYFPVLFLVKTQVAFLILMVVGLAVALARLRPGRRLTGMLAESFRRRLPEWVLGSFAVFYFGVSVAGNLNLGIRHILPVYTPLFVLVAIVTVRLVLRYRGTRYRPVAIGAVVVLLAWYAGSTVWSYPSYTAYFNELTGGPANAGTYFSDSSVDWGQDLGRLKAYLAAHPEIDHIAVDYFGGADPKYYFCPGRDCSKSVYSEWHSSYGPYTGQYIAVSETYLENDRVFAAQRGDAGYAYLRAQQPVAKIGYSIYLYKMY